ncbi:Flp family type IVb pilin [Aurantiacibacter suaedae]|uniref:Flp family type IVb pilin n=1 Tax=Aurantiacibacter suaedae TaxID=2545755 RepID=UPI0010FA058B|nr:UrcA family protein [Aurantiacibacter suaedae]
MHRTTAGQTTKRDDAGTRSLHLATDAAIKKLLIAISHAGLDLSKASDVAVTRDRIDAAVTNACAKLSRPSEREACVRDGTSAIEYVALAGLVAVGLIVVLATIGDKTSSKFSEVDTAFGPTNDAALAPRHPVRRGGGNQIPT